MGLIDSDNATHVRAQIKNQTAREAIATIMESLATASISERDAVMLASPELLDGLLFSSLDISSINDTAIIKRHHLGAPGAASGKVAMSTEQADRYIEAGEPFILVLPETRPEHVGYIEKAAGVVTFEGGMTSHASIITRQKGKPAVIGTGRLEVSPGDEISIDGGNHLVVRGALPALPPDPDNENLRRLLEVADSLKSDRVKKIIVKANADTPADAEKSKRLGAQGIGVVRTEHMFFGKDRLPYMQAMITAHNNDERKAALDKLFPMQKEDFKGILRAMEGLPVTIRLLDAPLHEFMPEKGSEQAYDLGGKLFDFAVKQGRIAPGAAYSELIKGAMGDDFIHSLFEHNPMLGKRAVRLDILNPGIYEMQVRAILEAVVELTRDGMVVTPQIMIPLVNDPSEFVHCRETVDRVVAEIREKHGAVPPYKLGIMTETPDACLQMKEFCDEGVEFISFGTNDLTQTSSGMSREDVGEVTERYRQNGYYASDPFQTIRKPMARLMKIAVTEGNQARGGLETSVCGEHGGDPQSIRTCQGVGVDCVSVSPPRLPVARLVAAQAMIEQEMRQGTWTERTGVFESLATHLL